ncbi:hypothetical protein CF651_07110 [Paenibacillus rigui]|uniref:Uncharacterized protein n=1 Tax=Paenibacillus rigui TaxID=554312 RepID=A0A229UVU6_9BACL|nr:hypothetical protein CF651_07110 [Paenibacillus rigui]
MITFMFERLKSKEVWKPISVLLLSLAFWIITLNSWGKFLTMFLKVELTITSWIDWPPWLETFLFISIVMFLLRLWWMKFWYCFEVLSELLYIKFTRALAHRGVLGMLIRTIKYYHSIHKPIISFFEINVYYGSGILLRDTYYRYFLHSILKSTFQTIINLFLNKTTIVAVVITIFLMQKTSIFVFWKKIKDIVITFKLDTFWNDVLPKIPTILALLGVIFILVYLNGTKGFIVSV